MELWEITETPCILAHFPPMATFWKTITFTLYIQLLTLIQFTNHIQIYSVLLVLVCVCKSIQFSTYEIYVSITTVQTVKISSSTWIPLVFLTILTILPFPLLLIPVCSTLFLDYDFNVNAISSEAPSLILVLVIYVFSLFFLC